jgi:outer membrane protein assembly factor BamB
MQITTVAILLVGLLAATTAAASAAEPVAEPGWPQANGPFGNFNPRQYGVKLLDDLSLARQVWASECRDLGFAKGSAAGYAGHLTDRDIHPGTASGLIVAEGKVFASSCKPRGGPWAQKAFNIAPTVANLSGERMEALRLNASFDADDLTVAIDVRTGKTVWKAVEEGKGLNRYSGKGGQFHGTPAYFEGKVLSVGTCGHVRCYDAATGRKLWEDANGSLVKAAIAQKAALMGEGGNLPGGGGMGISLAVARGADKAGVLVVPQYPGGTDVALRGMDVRTGKTLWVTAEAVTSRWATPAVWTHQGKQYLVVATVKGELRMIDPASGKVLWVVTGLLATHYSLTATARHVFVNIKSATMERPEQPWARMAAYRISPEKAEKAWEMPDKPAFWYENHFDICAMRRVLARDGRVYFFAQGCPDAPGGRATAFSILDENTGEVLLTSREMKGSPLFYLVEDRMLYTPDSAHGNTKRIVWEFYTTDPKGFRRLGSAWKPPHENTTAYEVFIELPYANGFFFMRNWQGQVLCYDLRDRPLTATWELEMRPASIGLDQIAKPLRLLEPDAGRIDQGTSFPPTSEQAGLPYGTWRRDAEWEPFACSLSPGADGRLAGTVAMDFGSVVIPVELALQGGKDGRVAGSWTRTIPASKVEKKTGALTGTPAQPQRGYLTPSSRQQSYTTCGTNPSGTTTTVLVLTDVTPGGKPATVTLCLDHDGRKVVRAGALPGPYGQSWHEVDARGLTTLTADRVEGDLVLILNRDKWQMGQTVAPGVAGRIHVIAERKGDALAGTWSAVWGEAYTFTGAVTGSRRSGAIAK